MVLHAQIGTALLWCSIQTLHFIRAYFRAGLPRAYKKKMHLMWFVGISLAVCLARRETDAAVAKTGSSAADADETDGYGLKR